MEETEFESLRKALVHYNATQRKIEIVTLLEQYNKPAVLYIQHWRGKISQKQAYRNLQTTLLWKEPRKLLREYYTDANGVLKCKHCGKVLTKSYTMHHNMYNEVCIVHPLYIDIICSGCHYKHHKK